MRQKKKEYGSNKERKKLLAEPMLDEETKAIVSWLKKERISKMLVVDDKEKNRKAAKEFFGELPFEVEYAKSGKEAMEKIRKGCYHLVITDLKMEKDESGLEVANEAWRYGAFAIIVSAFAHGSTEYTRIYPPLFEGGKIGGEIKHPPLEANKSQKNGWIAIMNYSIEVMSMESVHRVMKSLRALFEHRGPAHNSKYWDDEFISNQLRYYYGLGVY
ncbi:MAG: response regulator [Candidatus Anstonellales archaeon]